MEKEQRLTVLKREKREVASVGRLDEFGACPECRDGSDDSWK